MGGWGSHYDWEGVDVCLWGLGTPSDGMRWRGWGIIECFVGRDWGWMVGWICVCGGGPSLLTRCVPWVIMSTTKGWGKGIG